MKTDFTKPWNELTNEEKAEWDKKCAKNVMKGVSKFADTFNVDIGNCADLMKWNAEAEWNTKHVAAMRKAISTEGKIALKKAGSIEEYNAIFSEYAKKLEAVGF